jgi:hypothetical protein
MLPWPAPGLADRVFTRSEGNPLFMEALLRSDALFDAGLPESLRDLVLADVRRLNAVSRSRRPRWRRSTRPVSPGVPRRCWKYAVT